LRGEEGGDISVEGGDRLGREERGGSVVVLGCGGISMCI
jgi:hypothetical protein